MDKWPADIPLPSKYPSRNTDRNSHESEQTDHDRRSYARIRRLFEPYWRDACLRCRSSRQASGRSLSVAADLADLAELPMFKTNPFVHLLIHTLVTHLGTTRVNS